MLNFEPKAIEQINEDSLRITWADEHVSSYSFRYLRQNCPCAACRDEWSGAALLNPEDIPEDLAAKRAEVVGNYALSFAFSDGHGTGIYSFETLRKLCRCQECSPHPGSETN